MEAASQFNGANNNEAGLNLRINNIKTHLKDFTWHLQYKTSNNQKKH